MGKIIIGEDGFPVWSPQWMTKEKICGNNLLLRYCTLKNSSASFVQRKDVREFIFTRDNNKCVLCGATENLQIDHIVSIWRYAYLLVKLDYKKLNAKENLRVLCGLCNNRGSSNGKE